MFAMLLSLALQSDAAPITDTFANDSDDNTQNDALKLNQFEVNQPTSLLHIAPYLEISGSAEVDFVVYQESGGWGADWTRIYNSGNQTISGTGFMASPAVNLNLQAGATYLIGIHIDDDDVTYFFDDDISDEVVSWGERVGGWYTGDNDTNRPPDELNNWEIDDNGRLGYYTQLTVELPTDYDGDGSPSIEDCDDYDNTTYPGATEVCDGKDNDCDYDIDEGIGTTTWWPDTDVDGYGDPAGTTVETSCDAPPTGMVDNDDDCDDGNDQVHPGAPEACDGVDNDCDGILHDREVTDGDGDGVVDCEDCEATDPDIYPGAPDPCNGIDNDCDGHAPMPGECDTAVLDTGLGTGGGGTGGGGTEPGGTGGTGGTGGGSGTDLDTGADPYSGEGFGFSPACGCTSNTPLSAWPAVGLLALLGLRRRREI